MECVEERSPDKEESMLVLREVKHVKSGIESGFTYHSHCYKSITNKTDRNRSKKDSIKKMFRTMF